MSEQSSRPTNTATNNVLATVIGLAGFLLASYVLITAVKWGYQKISPFFANPVRDQYQSFQTNIQNAFHVDLNKGMLGMDSGFVDSASGPASIKLLVTNNSRFLVKAFQLDFTVFAGSDAAFPASYEWTLDLTPGQQFALNAPMQSKVGDAHFKLKTSSKLSLRLDAVRVNKAVIDGAVVDFANWSVLAQP